MRSWGEVEHRVTRFRRQLATLRQVWAQARQSDREHGVLGPPRIQDPGPPIWIGALTKRARQRAVELADGFISRWPGPVDDRSGDPEPAPPGS